MVFKNPETESDVIFFNWKYWVPSQSPPPSSLPTLSWGGSLVWLKKIIYWPFSMNFIQWSLSSSRNWIWCNSFEIKKNRYPPPPLMGGRGLCLNWKENFTFFGYSYLHSWASTLRLSSILPARGHGAILGCSRRLSLMTNAGPLTWWPCRG